MGVRCRPAVGALGITSAVGTVQPVVLTPDGAVLALGLLGPGLMPAQLQPAAADLAVAGASAVRTGGTGLGTFNGGFRA